VQRRAVWGCGVEAVNRDWCLRLGSSILGGYISCLREHKLVELSTDVTYPLRESCSR